MDTKIELVELQTPLTPPAPPELPASALQAPEEAKQIYDPSKFFEIEGYATLPNLLKRDYIEKTILSEAMSAFDSCFRIMHSQNHTPFESHRDVTKLGAEYALGLGARNGFKEIVRR